MNRRKCRPTGRRRRPSAKVTPLVPVLTRDHHMPAAGKRGLPEPAQQPREPYAALAAMPLSVPVKSAAQQKQTDGHKDICRHSAKPYAICRTRIRLRRSRQ